MHTRKKEFQILDSLTGGENISEATRKFVENFVSRIHVCTINHIICLPYVVNVFIFFCQREQLAGDIEDANGSAIMSFLDVSAWPIVPYDMHQQEDG